MVVNGFCEFTVSKMKKSPPNSSTTDNIINILAIILSQ